MDIYRHEMRNLTFDEALEMSALEYPFKEMRNKIFQINFRKMKRIEPFAMLVAAHVFRRWSNLCRENNVEIEFINYENCDYAGHMGFFKYFDHDFGKYPGEAKGSKKHLPITVINVSDLHEASKTKREQVQETINRKSTWLATILGQGNYDLELILSYSIREIMRNVVEHSQSKTITLAAQ